MVHIHYAPAKLFIFTIVAIVAQVNARKLGHNKIEAISNPKYDWWAERAKPMIRFDQGCYAYPAADRHGNYNGGLKASGSPGGGCRTSRFLQVYTRKYWIPRNQRARFGNARVAIMYAYFFPKDQGNRYGRAAARQYTFPRQFVPRVGWIGPFKFGGHRYDWEEVIIFLSNSGKAIKAAASFHGKYTRINRQGSSAKSWSGNRVMVKYGLKKRGSLKNNAMHFTEKGSTDRLKMLDWHHMTASMRSAINNVNWGKANPKIKDSEFMGRIYKAWG